MFATYVNKILGRKKTQNGGAEIPRMKQAVSRITQDAATRKRAVQKAEQGYFPTRHDLQTLYLNTAENGFISSCIDRRKDLTLLRKWEMKRNGALAEDAMALFFDKVDDQYLPKDWFQNFLSFVLDAKYYGYSLIKIGDIIDSQIVGTCLHPRENVNPDRLEATYTVGALNGVKFMEDDEVKNNYVYISTPNDYGNSPCGYGLFFWLSVYEIVLRNLISFNADYVEVNVAPFRQVKTHKKEDEQLALFNAAKNMAACGVAVTDYNDEIIFHNTSGASIYEAYGDLEHRLEQKIAQKILGHADAMSSIPGKLGNDNELSPAQKALRDKQTVDSKLVLHAVNNILLPRLIARGLVSLNGVVGIMINDNEQMDSANNLADLGVKMKQAGLQLSKEYFEEKTGISSEETQVVSKSNSSIQNRLNSIYTNKYT